MPMKLTLFFTFVSLNIAAFAQSPVTPSSSEILLEIQKLNTFGSVLYVAAHPDDENTRLLAYLANERKVRTGYLSLTRGDGGQNLIGTQQGEPLGLIRTNELLAARSVDKAEQFFTRANDFGYSKNPEETFTIWNRDSILADVVWTIRKFRPDVIICRFPTTGEGGHGHHTASAMLAEEAFDAAADPNRFPEQLKYVSVWQPKRLFWNTFNFGGTNTTSEDQLKLDVGKYNTLLGKYYGEVAAESRSMHKSQGFGSPKSRGSAFEYFKQLKGSPAKTDLFEGIAMDWSRVPALEPLGKKALAIQKDFDMLHPENSVEALAKLHADELHITQVADPDFTYWRKLKQAQTEQLLIDCSGIFTEAVAASPKAIPGKPLEVTAWYTKAFSSPMTLKSVTLQDVDSLFRTELAPGTLASVKFNITLADNTPLTSPYWMKLPHPVAIYTVPNQLQRGIPLSPAAMQATFVFDVMGEKIGVQRPVQYKWTDPVKGEIYRPLQVVPPAFVSFGQEVIVAADQEKKTVSVNVEANEDVSGELMVTAPAGWLVNIPEKNLAIANGTAKTVLVELIPSKEAESGNVSARFETGGIVCDQSAVKLEFDHIPYQQILKPASLKVVIADLKTEGKKIAYIPGAGDKVAECLQQVGYQVDVLSDDQIKFDVLKQYDAVISGVRTYNTNDKMQLFYDDLMKYVENGGNYIVQYNTNSRVGPVSGKIGPYPFTTSRNRVTDENARVEFVDTNDKVLNQPNKITEADFDGWVQERGIYFAADIDSHYRTVLRMHDPNEKDDAGSLIIAPYGKGNFVYTGLVFFRELPAGIPGAYRLMANLIAL